LIASGRVPKTVRTFFMFSFKSVKSEM